MSNQIILIVDDDVQTLLIATAILRRAGYTPIAASDPLEALTKSREFGGEIHLLLTDITMPEMDGLTLAQKMFEERVNIRILRMSRLTNISSRLPFLTKPFQIDQLLEKVANLHASPQPVAADVFAAQECSGRKRANAADRPDWRRRGGVICISEGARGYRINIERRGRGR